MNSHNKKFILFLFALIALAPLSSQNQDEIDHSDGNLQVQPRLSDYHSASRTPGFSPIVDIVDSNGN